MLFKWIFVFFTISMQVTYVPRLEPRYIPERTKTRALTGSTFGIYSQFRSGMEKKQVPVENLNFF